MTPEATEIAQLKELLRALADAADWYAFGPARSRPADMAAEGQLRALVDQIRATYHDH